jgi:solute carrier family 35 (adenosine 3'-phospho 5'-phosphosulfate transporter), member B3
MNISSTHQTLLPMGGPTLKMMKSGPLETDGFFEALPSSVQFSILTCGVFLFFGIHNLLQEAIMNVPEFRSGVMLGYFEVLGVCVCATLERHFIAKERGRVAPLSAYPLLTGCLMASSALSNISLNFINFPTKVVFRSCKLIPTMIIASVLHKKIFSSLDYFCAAAVCGGLVMFAAADWELTPTFHPIGLGFVSLSVFADAILPNAQERLFRLGSSRLEVTSYTNTFSLIILTCTTLASGDLLKVLGQMSENRQLTIYFAIYTLISYVAVSAHMMVVKRYGGVAAVLVATGRKAMTLILSFLLFPKGFSWFYPVGALLVLGGLLLQSLLKTKKKERGISHSEERPLKHHQSDVDDIEIFGRRKDSMP